MATRKQSDMKIPMRAAPPPPTASYQKQTSWKDDLFANDPFNSNPVQKKKPPPRPPPPKISSAAVSSRPVLPAKPNIPAKPDVPQRPSHFIRKPTILSSLINRGKPKPPVSVQNNSDFQAHVILPPPSRNDPSNTSSLIDFNSPPSSPTLTTRSSSDGLSVDSFGSDITSSTGNGNTPVNGGNTSQAESGFEDDFDIFSNKNGTDRGTPQDSWASIDPFSLPQNPQKPKVNRPVYDSDFLDPLCNGKTVKPSVQTHKLPTIIRAKPARPKTPKNSSLLSNSLVSAKISQINNGFSNNYSTIQENDDFSSDGKVFNDGNYSPPMPSVPPPPPPSNLEDTEVVEWNSDTSGIPQIDFDAMSLHEEPYGIALYDFPGSHEDDLSFRANDKIRLLRKLNDEWMFGKLRSGIEGMFPVNYITIQVPLPESNDTTPVNQMPKPFTQPVAYVTAMYDFVPQQEGDLGFTVGDKVKVLSKVTDEWLYGEIGINRGQFPANYVDHIPAGLPTRT